MMSESHLDELPTGHGKQRWLTFDFEGNREILQDMIDAMLAHKRVRIADRVTGKIHKVSIGKAGDVDVDFREVEVTP